MLWNGAFLFRYSTTVRTTGTLHGRILGNVQLLRANSGWRLAPSKMLPIGPPCSSYMGRGALGAGMDVKVTTIATAEMTTKVRKALIGFLKIRMNRYLRGIMNLVEPHIQAKKLEKFIENNILVQFNDFAILLRYSYAGLARYAADRFGGLRQRMHAACALGRTQFDLFDQQRKVDAEVLGGFDLASRGGAP